MLEATDRQLWDEYQRGDSAARERLILLYLPLAKRVAASLYARRAGNQVEFGDYLHLAYVGLIEAIQRYRSDSDAQFATFASYRIRGSVLNSIPKMTESGDRIGFLKKQRRERVRSVLESGDQPAREGIAGLLDMVIGIALTVQLEEIAETHGVEPTPANDPYASRAYDDMQRGLRDVVSLLGGRERQIIDFHYFHHMTFEDIAQALGVTKGRISQIHKQALEKVRGALQQRRLTELG